MANDPWAPHAEKEFGRFTREVGKVLPARLTELRRTGRRLLAITATTKHKAKG